MAGMEVVATGSGFPKQKITNEDLSKIVDTSDEWIVSRTGIKERYFCKEEKNWQLAYEAAKQAIERAEKLGVNKKEIGLLIVATFTPDYATPSVSCILQKELGLESYTIAFDINAACSGFLYSLKIANSMLNDLKQPYALIIGSEQISTRLDMNDRGTCVLFGDGAGAVLVKRNDKNRFVSILGSEGEIEALGCNGHTSDSPYIFMDGKKVYKKAVKNMVKVANEVLLEAGLSVDDIDYVIFHQANLRIIQGVMKYFDIPIEKTFINIDKYGNTSAACMPIILNEMYSDKILKKGMKLLLVGFGAGFTWGGTVFEI